MVLVQRVLEVWSESHFPQPLYSDVPAGANWGLNVWRAPWTEGESPRVAGQVLMLPAAPPLPPRAHLFDPFKLHPQSPYFFIFSARYTQIIEG